MDPLGAEYWSDKTYLLDLNTFSWYELPPRVNYVEHFAGLFKNDVGEKQIAFGNGDEVVIFDPQSMSWRSGPSMPQPLWASTVVQYDDHFILVGGIGVNGLAQNDLWRFDGETEDWHEMLQTLQQIRSSSVAILVSDQEANCF